MSLDDFLNDVRLIMQADPEALNQFADQWQQISGTFQAQSAVLVRAINDAGVDAQGTTAASMSNYGRELGEGMTALSAASAEIAAGLRDIAPRLQKIQQDLNADVTGLLDTVGAALVPASAPTLAANAIRVVGGADLMSLVSLVNDYQTTMTTLATALTTAETKFQVLDALNDSTGIVPTAPHVTR